MSCTIIILVFVEFELIGFFLDGIISEVHEQVVNVFGILARRLIFLCGKTCEAFLVDINSKGVYAIDQSVNPQIKFQAVY